MQTTNQNECPLVSFIIAYYELPVKMLRECIDSIMALSLLPSEREIIVVDDGSEKSPLSLLDNLAEQIVWIHQYNQGLSSARNTGIRMAQGKYLQFIDSDDTLLKEPYEHCIFLLRSIHPEMVVFDLSMTPQASSNYHDSDLLSGSAYMRSHNIHGSACGYLFRRDILGELRFTPGIYNEDEEFTPQLLLRAETVCVSDAKAYHYRRRPDSIITSKNIRNCLKRLNDTKAIIYRLNILADRLPTEDRIALQRRIAQLTMDYLYNVIRQTQSRRYLERRLEELRLQGLFPLPDCNYTKKYTWFRRLSNSQKGISVLMHVIKIIKSEQ